MKKTFLSFRDAARYANDLAKKNRSIIEIKNEDNHWIVSDNSRAERSQVISHAISNTYAQEIEDTYVDQNGNDLNDEIADDLCETAENYARSEENGWYYPEYEGDEIDNCADTSSDIDD